MNQITCIVVGAGGISNAWFPALKNENVAVSAVIDLNKTAAEEKIAKHSLTAEAGTDMAELIRKYKPNFVVDLTIPDAHRKVTVQALEMGCHVVGEKPMASSMADARAMVEASEKSGKLYMVSQSRRWTPHHSRLANTIAGGEIGPVTTINCDFFIAAHFGGFRDEMASPLILDMSIHHFDLARYISGADPVSVYAHEFNPAGSWYRGDASAVCVYEMSNGLVFTYRASWCSEGCHTSWNGNWRVIGQKGTLLMEDDKEPRGEVVASEEGFIRNKRPANIANPSDEPEGMQSAVRAMVDYLRTGKVPATECHDNIKSLNMVFAAIESSKKKRITM